jgi:Trm5-related predicted tRNA methylase
MNGCDAELVTSEPNSPIFVVNLRVMSRTESNEKPSNDAESQ